MPEPYEIALNFLLQEFNELRWMVRAKAFAIAGNADVSFTGRNHKLVSIAFCRSRTITEEPECED